MLLSVLVIVYIFILSHCGKFVNIKNIHKFRRNIGKIT